MKLNLLLFASFIFLFFGNNEKHTLCSQSEPEFRFMFYNTENLFDTYNDSLTQDDDFLPEGNYHWTRKRFNDKINKIYKVIALIGGWNPPDIVGLCEIENRYVLEQLTQNTPLLKHNYQVIHKNSPDRRGIDVGLLYNPKTVIPIKKEFIKVNNPKDPLFLTRDILYFKCQVKNDTLHFFINHWPSRWSGQFQSEEKRLLASTTLRHKIDSCLSCNDKAKIIVAGDFNDTPDDKSISEILRAKMDFVSPKESDMYNLSVAYCGKYEGTHKYGEEWSCLDQIIVSGELLKENGISTTPSMAHVFSQSFLLEGDNKFNNQKPFRTYVGMKYNGGFSDHLPVYLDLFTK